MEAPDTHYARSGDLRVAYQIVGDGPIDLVYVPGLLNNIEAGWQEPAVAGFYERCARFARLIIFDRRGVGLSDQLVSGFGSSIEERIDDVRAVMDAAGSKRAAIYGNADGGPIAMVFGATYPERTAALVLSSTGARVAWAPDYPWGRRDPAADGTIEFVEREWGTGVTLRIFGLDESQRRAFARMERLTGTPTAAAALMRATYATDVRDVLPTIGAPTLVIGVRDHPLWVPEHLRFLVDHIAGARLVEIERIAPLPGTGADPDELPGVIEEFLTGARTSRDADRVLKTVLFTDIVSSTDQAATLGDRRWRSLLDQHDGAVREELSRAQGQEVKTTGDGFVATFDGPARAVRCAHGIVRRSQALSLDVRAGLHTGEIELRGDDIGGIAVHIAQRIQALAHPGEVVASRTVKDLTAGSGLQFTDRGEHALKGVPDLWQIYAVEMQ